MKVLRPGSLISVFGFFFTWKCAFFYLTQQLSNKEYLQNPVAIKSLYLAHRTCKFFTDNGLIQLHHRSQNSPSWHLDYIYSWTRE